jgi:hypothetical protein
MKPGVPSAARYQWRLLDLLIVTLLVAVHLAIQAFVTSGIYFLVLGMIRRWRSRRASQCEPKTGSQNLEH